MKPNGKVKVNESSEIINGNGGLKWKPINKEGKFFQWK